MANWLYNGVSLPPLPDVDATVYPYAFIYDLSNRGEYRLEFTSMPFTYHGGTLYKNEVAGKWRGFWCYSDAEAWENTSPATLDFSAGEMIPWAYVVWSNYDILNADGTLHFAASQPVDPSASVPGYIGDASGIARQLEGIYIGDGHGLAHKVLKVYVGDENGVAAACWEDTDASL